MGGRGGFPPASWIASSGSELQQSTDRANGRVTCGRCLRNLAREEWQAGDFPGKAVSGLRSYGIEPKRCGGEYPFPPHSKQGRLLRSEGRP